MPAMVFAKRATLLLLAALLLFASNAGAHEAEGEPLDLSVYNSGEDVYLPLAAAGALILAVSVASVLLEKRMGEAHKKAAFYAIAGLSLISTGYLVFSVAFIMLGSATGGPVHWHADFEVWACGEKLALKEAEGYSTRVGPKLLHHHGDSRIHVEGVVRRLDDVKLANFFKAIGGGLAEDSVTVVLKDGRRVRYHDGDLCGGTPGTLKVFVNGKPEPRMGEYVLSPYTDIPPGDVIKIVFD